MTGTDLDALIESALIDTWDEEEALSAWLTVLQDEVGLPFTASVLGVEATVNDFELLTPGCIVAVCRRGRHRQRVPLTDLALADPPPTGSDWIAAYGLWCRRW